MFAQPAVIARVGGDAVQAEIILIGVEFIQQAMKRKDARTFGFADHAALQHGTVSRCLAVPSVFDHDLLDELD
jgi:hypothetical protein